MLKSSLVAVALLATSQAAMAQPVIGGGGLLHQIPPPPPTQKSIPDLRIERATLEVLAQRKRGARAACAVWKVGASIYA